MGERRDRLLPATRSCLWIGLHPSSHRPHWVVEAGIMENAMAAINPAAEALEDLLRSDVFFAASRVGQSVEEILGYLRRIWLDRSYHCCVNWISLTKHIVSTSLMSISTTLMACIGSLSRAGPLTGS